MHSKRDGTENVSGDWEHLRQRSQNWHHRHIWPCKVFCFALYILKMKLVLNSLKSSYFWSFTAGMGDGGDQTVWRY